MDSNYMYNIRINDEDFPPIQAGIHKNQKSTEVKENLAGCENNISPIHGIFTTDHTQIHSNTSFSPPEFTAGHYQELLDISLTPRKKAMSAFQARYLALSSRKIPSPPDNDNSMVENELDPLILARREKQIDYGKSTPAYDRYLKQVAQDCRAAHMPRTPDKSKKYSRRQFDGMIKTWKIRIHNWDMKKNGIILDQDYLAQTLHSNGNSNTSIISVGNEMDDIMYDIPLEKTSTEKAIEKAIMDWRDEYRVKDDSEEVEKLSMVKKFKLGSPSNINPSI